MSTKTLKPALSVFSLVMINVIAVDSIRTIPFSAAYGLSLVTFYVIAGLTFFLPTALVAAELASGWPKRGGIYVWVKEALGKPIAFSVIWIQWIYNICWYPTILSLLATTFAYLVHPEWADNKLYTLSIIFFVYWVTTFINIQGMRASSYLSTITAIVGTLVPMLLIIALGFYWLADGQPTAITFNVKNLIPSNENLQNIMFFSNVLFGLAGIEMSAVHAQEVKNPQRDYPRALLYSSILIFFTLVLSSLAVAIVVPQLHLELVSGLLEAYRLFFKAYHITYLMPVIGTIIIIGIIGGVGAWIIGPSKGLLVAAEDGCIPKWFGQTNKKQVPVNILWAQGLVFTLLCSAFIIMPTVNSSFWILSNLTAMLALVLYITMFASSIILRYKFPNQIRPYKIPGGKAGIWCIGVMGIITCIITIAISFIPPPHMKIGSLWVYEGFLIAGFVGFCLLPFLIYCLHKK